MGWNRVSQYFTALIAVFFLAGCGASDYPRGQFSGYVIGKTEEQIVAQVGKPHEVDASNPASPVWIYKKKTFDADNNNKGDDKVLVFMKKGADGKLMGQDTVFQ
jgi:hypothetical protein